MVMTSECGVPRGGTTRCYEGTRNVTLNTGARMKMMTVDPLVCVGGDAAASSTWSRGDSESELRPRLVNADGQRLRKKEWEGENLGEWNEEKEMEWWWWIRSIVSNY